MSGGTGPGDRVLRADDPEATRLRAAGWTVVAESWGARLRLGEPPDAAHLDRLWRRVAAARERGYVVVELAAADLPAVAELEARTAADYPLTPATDVPARTVAWLAELDARLFAARPTGDHGADGDGGGRLAAVTATTVGPGRVETVFTSVAAEHRRRGLAAAVKAASVLAAVEDGHRVLGTGGAALNAGSLAMNAAVGYEVTERWLSLRPPAPRTADVHPGAP